MIGRGGLAALAAAVVTLASSCSYKGAESLPLPGAISGTDTYRVSAVFADATNLVPKETCRANDSIVGSVESVTLTKDLKARVVCDIRNSIQLPANSVGTLQETSLLGERFVSLGPPRGQAPIGRLRHGAELPENQSQVDPNVEQVLGALSAVLNGGSIGRLADISQETNTALQGRGGDIRGLFEQLNTLAADLNQHRVAITTALDALDHLSATVSRQRDTLGAAITTVPDGLAALDRQRPRLTATLRQLSELSDVVVPLINQSHDNTVADLRNLQPFLSEMTKAGDQIASSLDITLSFPFPRNTLSVLKGDYGGFFGVYNVSADTINGLLRASNAPATPLPNLTPAPGAQPLPGELGGANPPVAPAPPPDLGHLLTGGSP